MQVKPFVLKLTKPRVNDTFDGEQNMKVQFYQESCDRFKGLQIKEFAVTAVMTEKKNQSSS